jgi:SAM-dependent methyltransferase
MRLPLLLAGLALLGACTFQGTGIAPFNPAPAPVSERDLEVPYVPTPPEVVEAMLDLAQLGTGDLLIDLGSGDGRIPIAAARRGARALGVDIDSDRVSQAVLNARMAELETRALFRIQDLFQTPIRDASVVAIYLMPEINLRLRPRLLTELRPGARVVSHAFDMGDWRADEHEVVDGRNIYLWVVPAEVAGRWTLTDPDGAVSTLDLDQRFQDVSGTLGRNGQTLPLGSVTLRGSQLRFTAGDRTYWAVIDGAIMTPDPDGGTQPAWRAQRNS